MLGTGWHQQGPNGDIRCRISLKKFRCVNFLPMMDSAVSTAFKLPGMRNLERLDMVNCHLKGPFFSMTGPGIGIQDGIGWEKLKTVQLFHSPDVQSVQRAMFEGRLKSLEALTLVSARQSDPENWLVFNEGKKNLKSFWGEYWYQEAKWDSYYPYMINTKYLWEDHTRIRDFTPWLRLEELAITRTSLIIGRRRLNLPTSLRKLCVIQTKEEIRETINAAKSCENLLAGYSIEQVKETGEIPNLEVVAVGIESACLFHENDGRVELEEGDLFIVFAKHKFVGNLRKSKTVKTSYRRIGLEEAWEMFPDSHVLGPKSGPWGWFR
ncbi:hypothetical protein TWF694_011094 [Orbilia ellipsospora]|uniref:Uncharacterized protein n=1 Tax=Orbilia ellipsospora TaxID=2528407 RepID=A0AAV9X8E5_9PEZI